MKYKCNKQNIEMKVKIMPRSRGKEKKLTHRPRRPLCELWSRVTYSSSWGFILMTSSHILSAFFPLLCSPSLLETFPCLQESMARKRIYSLKGGNKFCAFLSLLSMKGFSVVIPTFESFLSSLSFQALVTIPQISTNT